MSTPIVPPFADPEFAVKKVQIAKTSGILVIRSASQSPTRRTPNGETDSIASPGRGCG